MTLVISLEPAATELTYGDGDFRSLILVGGLWLSMAKMCWVLKIAPDSIWKELNIQEKRPVKDAV